MKPMRSSAYHKTTLESGVRVISQKISHVRSISLGVWIDVGSKDESPSQYGVSHFIEHMLFKGTKKRSAKDIAISLESLGGSLNAFTSREQTCYYARILDEHLLEAIDVLSDILKNSLIAEDEFKKEKKVILEELKDLEDVPGDLVHDILMQNIWPKQPLGQPIIGTKKSVSRLTRQQLVSYLKRNYRNSNVVISACGNLEHRSLVNMVKNHFRFSSNLKLKKGSTKKPAPLRGKNSLTVTRKDFAQTHICLGMPAYPYDSEKRYVISILNNILGEGMSSRLFQSIREDLGLAYSISSFIDFFKDTGIFGVYLATDKEQVIQAMHSVLDEVKKLKNKKLSAKELHRAKNQIKGNLMIGLESTSNLMGRLARNELYLNRHISLNQTLANIDKVKATQVSDVANELFDKDRLCLAILGPTDKTIIRKIDWDR